MNLLEQYIQPGWTTKSVPDDQLIKLPANIDWVLVDYRANCYGAITEYHDIPWPKAEWEQSVKRGYYMA